MKFVFALVLTFGVANICNADPTRKDNTQLEEEGEKFVYAKFEEFHEAASTGIKLNEYFNDLLTYVKQAHRNNRKLIMSIKSYGFLMKTMTTFSVNFFSKYICQELQKLLDENRHNVSYYVLDYSSKWLEARLPSVLLEKVEKIMEQAKTAIEIARDNLYAHAQVFVGGVKNISEWTSNGKGSSHSEEIKNTIANLDKLTADKTFSRETNEAVELIESLAKKVFDVGFASCVSYKKDDTPQLEEEGQKFVDAKLKEFKEAASAGKDLSKYFKDLLTYVKEVTLNMLKFSSYTDCVGKQMQGIISRGVHSLASQRLHTLKKFLYGNTDMVSYYVLDYSSKWLEARLPLVLLKKVEQIMEEAKTEIQTARDNLYPHAQVFVQRVKNILEWTSNGEGPSHSQEIRDTIHAIYRSILDIKLYVATTQTVKKIKSLAKKRDLVGTEEMLNAL